MKSFKEQCVALRKKDKTINEIMAITGRSKSSIHFHIKDIPLSQKKMTKISERSRRQALSLSGARKGKSQRSFKSFDTWTPDLVLLVSHLMFDGEILKQRCSYNNRVEALIQRVERLMQQVYDFPPKLIEDKVSVVYKIRYYNVALGNYLFEKAVELQQNVLDYQLDLQREFLRAFFDDEGCMDYRPKRNLRRVRGYQKDRKILLLVQKLLSNFGIESVIREPNEVVITKKENLIKFQKEINFSKGVSPNPNRSNGLRKQEIEKREILDQAIKSFKS